MEQTQKAFVYANVAGDTLRLIRTDSDGRILDIPLVQAAAAPDLLAALERWNDAWSYICENPPHHALRDAAHAGRAAIAKAKA